MYGKGGQGGQTDPLASDSKLRRTVNLRRKKRERKEKEKGKRGKTRKKGGKKEEEKKEEKGEKRPYMSIFQRLY